MIHLIVPAYNEVDNVPRLMADLAPRTRELGARVLVVDDGSTDGTAEAIAAHATGLDLVLLRHPQNRGVGAALDTGLRSALETADGDDALITLEADATSDLADLPNLLVRFGEGYDLVLASIHAPGGRTLGVPAWRRLASRTLTRVVRAAGGPPGVHTVSSLYRVYRASALRRLMSDGDGPLVHESGFAASVELLVALHRAGATVTEVPTTNDWTTRTGASTLALRSVLPAYGRLLARMAWR